MKQKHHDLVESQVDMLAFAAREIEEWKQLQKKQFRDELAQVGINLYRSRSYFSLGRIKI